MSATYSTPTSCGLNRASVEILAASTIKHVGYLPGDDLDASVTKLGGRIQYSDSNEVLLNSDSGSLVVNGPANFEINLATNTSQIRDRFTIAHEIGHYVLHYLYARQVLKQDVLKMKATRYGSGEVEREANWFAAAFLMPKEAFTEEFKKFHSPAVVSLKFKVSMQAAEIRAKVLGLD